jgi:lauroyl/myristoyl acyltransferase
MYVISILGAMQRVETYADLLKAIPKLNDAQLKALINKSTDNEFIATICEICFNEKPSNLTRPGDREVLKQLACTKGRLCEKKSLIAKNPQLIRKLIENIKSHL